MKRNTETALTALLAALKADSIDTGEEITVLREVGDRLLQRRDELSHAALADDALTKRALAIPAVKTIVDEEKRKLAEEPVVPDPTPAADPKLDAVAADPKSAGK